MISKKMRMPLAGLALLATIGVASAHHGWNSFDTRRAYYASGTITEVRWGNPHSIISLRVENTSLPGDWSSRPLPPDAIEEDGKATMVSARPYDGEYKELNFVLAPPQWMQRWGLDRELKVGEKFEVVGYLATSDNQNMRAVMFWLDDGQGVWQQLTPFPTRPEPANN